MKRVCVLFPLLLCFSFCAASGCGDRRVPAAVARLADSLRMRYAPDPTTAVFDVDYSFSDRRVMLRGQTTSRDCCEALAGALRSMGYEVMDCLQVLPDEELGERTYAIVCHSVCNLRAAPDYSSEMVTQGLLGMPLRVLEGDGWYRVQTPDDYIAWVSGAAVRRVTLDGLREWNSAEKAVVTAHFGFVRSQPDERSLPVSDVVAGDRLRLLGRKGAFYEVAYPDGRTGFVHRSVAVPETQWRAGLRRDAGSIVATALTLTGVPYLWAGTSSKGVDCSGFVRAVLLMHDIIIPRDASQQAAAGERVEIAPDFSNLQAGDLLFFGRRAEAGRAEAVVHVGIYMGGLRFIHSMGDVHVSSFDPEDELFDAYDLGRLLYAARVLPHVDRRPQLNTTATNPYYNL